MSIIAYTPLKTPASVLFSEEISEVYECSIYKD